MPALPAGQAAVAAWLILAAQGTETPARYLGRENFPEGSCATATQSVLIDLGPHHLRVPLGDLKRLKSLAPATAEEGCRQPIPAEDLLISTPDGFRGYLTYKAIPVTPDDAARVRDTLKSFYDRPTCETRTSVRICRIRPNPTAPVTTFVFATDPASTLASGAPAYLCCGPGPSGAEVCRIQDLVPDGYQYSAAVANTDDGAAIIRLHRIATGKWRRFTRAAETAPSP